MFDATNSNGSINFMYNTSTGVLKNTTHFIVTILVSGQVTTNCSALNTLFIKKNLNSIISSSAINFNGNSFSSVIVLYPNDIVTIEYIQYTENTITILNGQYVSRITFTQLDYITGATGPTGSSMVYLGNSSLWMAPEPTTPAEAIERLAKAMVGLLGTKIP